MKLLLGGSLFFTLMIIGLSDKAAVSKELWNECLTVNEITAEEARAAFRNAIPSTEVKEGIKCQWKCWFEKQGLMAAGVYNEEAAISLLKGRPDLREYFIEIERAIKDCKYQKGVNDCETAYKIGLCLRKENGIPEGNA